MEPSRERAFNIPGIILALVVLMGAIHGALAFVLSSPQTDDIMRLFAFTPLRYVVNPPPGIPAWWGPQLWTFVSYAFLHADLNHLFFNMVWLLAFGPPIARRFGTPRFLAFCALTAAVGALAHLLGHAGQREFMIGASAAISGLMAAAMRFVFQHGGPLGLIGHGEDDASYRVPAAPLQTMLTDPRILLFLAIWFGTNFLFGMGIVQLPGSEGRIAWEAHIGGFVTGLFAFSLFDPPTRPAPEPPSLDPRSQV